VSTVQRTIAIACVVAAAAVLAGVGWALLTAGLILFVVPVRAGRDVMPRLRDAAAAARRAVVHLRGRRAVAASAMIAAVLLLPVGVALVSNTGAGLIAAAASLAGVSLLYGWNAT
jgi:hypothetical protein